MEDKDRFIDELVDSALAQLRGAEPLAGFEGRVLERVRAASTMRASSSKPWTIGTAVAVAAAALVVVVYVARRPHSTAAHTPQASNIHPPPAPRQTLPASPRTTPEKTTVSIAPESKRIVRRAGKSSRPLEAHHWPSQFPTPAPLSPEEKALVQYVRETPPQVLAASLFKGESMDRPAKIKPLKIAPLEIKPLDVGPPGEEIQ